MANTVARGIQVSPEVWEALDRLRQRHGSIDAALRAVLPDFDDDGSKSQRTAASPTGNIDHWRSKRKPLLRPGEKE